MDRRTFLRAAPPAALGGLCLLSAGCASDPPAQDATTQTADSAAASTSASQAPAGRAVLQHPGVQLYTLRSLLEDDFAGTLEQVAAIGYKEVEFAGLYDQRPADVRALLDDLGLRAPSGHTLLEAMQSSPDTTIETARALGHDYLVCAYLAEEQRTSMDDYRAHADTFNQFGERCQQAGLQFAYHNHDFEFETFGGEQSAYDLLLERTDPALVAMELDLYWTAKAGHHPLAYFERYPGRFPLWHVKDLAADGAIADVGQGTIDFAKLFAQAQQAGLEHAFVEHDNTQDPLATIRTSYQHLKKLAS